MSDDPNLQELMSLAKKYGKAVANEAKNYFDANKASLKDPVLALISLSFKDEGDLDKLITQAETVDPVLVPSLRALKAKNLLISVERRREEQDNLTAALEKAVEVVGTAALQSGIEMGKAVINGYLEKKGNTNVRL